MKVKRLLLLGVMICLAGVVNAQSSVYEFEFKDGYFAGTTLVKEPAIVKFDFRSESGKIIIKAYKKNNPSEIIKTVTITPSSCGLLSLKGRYGDIEKDIHYRDGIEKRIAVLSVPFFGVQFYDDTKASSWASLSFSGLNNYEDEYKGLISDLGKYSWEINRYK